MPPSKKAALLGALCADAYALGAHWVYDTEQIAAAGLDTDGYNDPITAYHGDKKAGEFTHYGDQTVWLLESIALEGEFVLDAFCKRWKAYMQEYKGYIDSASKATLVAMNAGRDALHCGSDSRELSVAGRIAPLLFCCSDDKERLLKDIQLHTRLTHCSPLAEAAARYFGEVAFALLEGETVENALIQSIEDYDDTFRQWFKVGMRSTHFDTTEAIKSFGQSCSVNAGLSGVVHLLCKYSDNYLLAMQENVKAGGDSAARGMVAGMLLGAHNGEECIPPEWVQMLAQHDHIVKLMEIIDG